jgi:hypothetical protein
VSVAVVMSVAVLVLIGFTLDNGRLSVIKEISLVITRRRQSLQ